MTDRFSGRTLSCDRVGCPDVARSYPPNNGREYLVSSKPTLDQMKRRHAELEAKISAEEARPAPDEALLAKWKKQKLSLKDSMLVRHAA